MQRRFSKHLQTKSKRQGCWKRLNPVSNILFWYPLSWRSTLILTYALILLLWSPLYVWWTKDQFWPIAVGNTAYLYLFFLYPLLLLIFLTSPRFEHLYPLLIPIALFLTFWGNLFWPILPAAEANRTADTITAATYNLLYSNSDRDRLQTVIDQINPDLIGLQEVNPHLIRYLERENPAELSHHAYYEVGFERIGFSSRFPIIETAPLQLPHGSLAVYAKLDLGASKKNEQPLHLFVAHLAENDFVDNRPRQIWRSGLKTGQYGERIEQVNFLLQKIEAIGRNEPVILLCDCNMTEGSGAYRHLSSRLNDGYRQIGRGFGHSVHPKKVSLRIARIDYVWHSHDLQPVSGYVADQIGSDHYPVVIQFEPNGEGKIQP